MSGLLVITAHPDDEVLLAGGTLAALSHAGEETGVVCLTRGELGPIADPDLASPATLADVRLAELEAACAELGVGFVKCYRRRDGHLRFSNRSAIAAQLTRLLNRRRPDAVVSFGEDGLYYHPDHIATCELVARAVARAEPQPALYRAVWPKHLMTQFGIELRRRNLRADLWGLQPADFGVEDLDGAFALDVRRFARKKLRALMAHRTQIDAHNAFGVLEREAAERILGTEWFAAVAGSDGEWLRARLA
jgi:LmbE family N-acetylglucosaminyl deacetylase